MTTPTETHDQAVARFAAMTPRQRDDARDRIIDSLSHFRSVGDRTGDRILRLAEQIEDLEAARNVLAANKEANNILIRKLRADLDALNDAADGY